MCVDGLDSLAPILSGAMGCGSGGERGRLLGAASLWKFPGWRHVVDPTGKKGDYVIIHGVISGHAGQLASFTLHNFERESLFFPGKINVLQPGLHMAMGNRLKQLDSVAIGLACNMSCGAGVHEAEDD